MYCTACGALISENVNVCPKCGEVHDEIIVEKENKLKSFNNDIDDVPAKEADC